ncbi:MAG: MFS transporter [Sedimenticola sp.]
MTDKHSLAFLLRIFIPFALGYFLSYLFRVVNAVIAPDLTAELALNANQLGLLTSAYFLTFAAFQLPLGILLDRYGPRRIEAALLLFAAAGALVFSLSESVSGLILGRALIGFGVSACLMAAFKSFVQWFPANRLPMANGLQLASGGLGALAATTPVETALQFTDWRGVFMALALLSLVVSALLFALVPDKEEKHPHIGMADHIQGILHIFTSRLFWRITPWAVASQAGFLSIQSLWAGPWLRDVAGFDRDTTALYLAFIASAMVAGFALIGFTAGRLSKLGITTTAVAGTGMALFMVAQAGIVFGFTELALPLWLMFGFFGTSGTVTYAVLSQNFAPNLAGRVNTAHNLLVFIVAFAGQWGIGAIIDLWPRGVAGGYAPEAFQWAFAIVLLAQVVTMLWFFLFKASK